MSLTRGVDDRDLSATEWVRRLRRREISSRELVEHYQMRIERVNPHLNAVAVLDPVRALSEADAADSALARGTELPLLGLPVTIKDSLEVAGLVSSGGSLARSDHIPQRDATVVARLRASGAIVLAKTNVPEYSCSYETDNLLYGRTNNPYDLDRTPGGSSGGEAALAAARATPLGIGTDGLGSIRVPAHYCGVLGLRPTVGRVPETGNWPATRASGYMDFYSIGPITRHPEDAALALQLIAGPDGVDPYAVPVPLADQTNVSVEGLRVGLFTRSAAVASTPGTVAAIEAVAGILEAIGARIENVQLPWSPNPTDLGFSAMVADGGAQMRFDVRKSGGRHHPSFQEFLEVATERALNAKEWFEVQREIFDLRRRVRALFEQIDILVGPVVSGPAPRHGEPPAGLAVEDYYDYHAFDPVHLIALAGLPAASVPAGQELGLPIGVQVAAAPFREDVVLAVAEVIMRSLKVPLPSDPVRETNVQSAPEDRTDLR